MKTIALHSIHEALNAKMVPFAGYIMPVQYEGVTLEHQTVREGVGVFDVSHMGEFIIEGPMALELIQSISSNDASKLTIGKAQYSCLPNDIGGIVDDLIIYKIKEEEIKHIMKLNLKKGSYKLWRVRVNSRSRRKKECVGRDND